MQITMLCISEVEMDADNYAVYQYKLYISPVLDRFEYQCNIDRGRVRQRGLQTY